MKIAACISHPIQYYAPIFRELAGRCDLHVFYGQRLLPEQQKKTGFGTAFEWDIDLLSGYRSTFLQNRSANPGPSNFFGCDTPQIDAFIEDGKFDAILITGWYLKSYLQALVAAKKRGVPVLVRGDSHLHSTASQAKRYAKKVVYPFWLRLFDGALYVGEKSREFFEHYNYPSDRLFFSPHCVDNSWFSERSSVAARVALRSEHGVGEDAFVVLFAGKLVRFKRPLDAVQAVALSRSRGGNVHLMVAGSGELRAEIEASAKALKVPLHMLGFCNQSQMPSAYAAADAVMLPSDGRETWGLVINEALACGKSIIVSRACGCTPDLVEEGATGYSAPLGDIMALSKAIDTMMANPLHPTVIAEKISKYSLSKAVDGILAGAESLVRRGPTTN